MKSNQKNKMVITAC